MHRALFTWFILLVFLIILSLRLETRTHWNWFLIFLPMWVFDAILLIDALFHIFVICKHGNPLTIFKNENITLIVVALLKIAAQIIICLKLEYESLQLSMYHVLIPFWILLPVLIINVTMTLIKNGNYARS